jgi:uncharacterized protein YacL (UPF0231 family)
MIICQLLVHLLVVRNKQIKNKNPILCKRFSYHSELGITVCGSEDLLQLMNKLVILRSKQEGQFNI